MQNYLLLAVQTAAHLSTSFEAGSFSGVIERIETAKLQHNFSAAYRQYQLAEQALLIELVSDITWSVHRDRVVVMFTLDMMAAFYTFDQDLK